MKRTVLSLISPSSTPKGEAMLREMIRERLGKADLKAIARSRGFTEENTAAPDLLEHAFLTGLGVEKALATLEPREVLLLHLLQCLGREVEIGFFERLYGPDGEADQDRRWLSFNDRYRPIFNRVQSNLVRKGVLIVAEEKDFFSRKSVLEKLRFCFPGEFAPFLPPPFVPVRLDGEALGEYCEDFPRRKLREVLDQEQSPPGTKEGPPRVRIEDGELLVGRDPFSVKRFSRWRDLEWETACPVSGKEKSPAPISLVECALYALSRLRDDEAAAPAGLLPLWRLAIPGAKLPEADSFCEAGWQRGCLERLAVAGKKCYRLPRAEMAHSRKGPEEYLDLRDPAAVGVDLGKIPLPDFERLASVSRLEVRGGRLLAMPNFLKLSRASEEALREGPLPWLGEKHPGFREVLRTIRERKGKVIVHQNLLIARIRELALKVMIEKKLSEGGRLVSLSEEFVAFPPDLLREILPLLKREGHVIKTVSAYGKA